MDKVSGTLITKPNLTNWILIQNIRAEKSTAILFRCNKKNAVIKQKRGKTIYRMIQFFSQVTSNALNRSLEKPVISN